MADLKVTGLVELARALKKNVKMDDVKTVVQKNGADLQRTMQRKADFKKGYQTGTTKQSIRLNIKDGGFTAEVGPTTEYSPYLEYGTRYMEKQPFVKPALAEIEPKFNSDMRKLVK